MFTDEFIEQLQIKIPSMLIDKENNTFTVKRTYTRTLNKEKYDIVDEIIYKARLIEMRNFKKTPHYAVVFVDSKKQSQTGILLVSTESHNIIQETLTTGKPVYFPYSQEDVKARKKAKMKELWDSGKYNKDHNKKRQESRQEETKNVVKGKLKLNENLLDRYNALLQLTQNDKAKSELQKVIKKLEKNIASCEKRLSNSNSK